MTRLYVTGKLARCTRCEASDKADGPNDPLARLRRLGQRLAAESLDFGCFTCRARFFEDFIDRRAEAGPAPWPGDDHWLRALLPYSLLSLYTTNRENALDLSPAGGGCRAVTLRRPRSTRPLSFASCTAGEALADLGLFLALAYERGGSFSDPTRSQVTREQLLARGLVPYLEGSPTPADDLDAWVASGGYVRFTGDRAPGGAWIIQAEISEDPFPRPPTWAEQLKRKKPERPPAFSTRTFAEAFRNALELSLPDRRRMMQIASTGQLPAAGAATPAERPLVELLARLEERQERAAIDDLCAVLDLALTGERRGRLAAMSLAELRGLRAQIRSNRRWPD